jgi:hypothetical protein
MEQLDLFPQQRYVLTFPHYRRIMSVSQLIDSALRSPHSQQLSEYLSKQRNGHTLKEIESMAFKCIIGRCKGNVEIAKKYDWIGE